MISKKRIIGMTVIGMSIILLCGNTLFARANEIESEAGIITVDPVRAIIIAIAAVIFGAICVAWRHRKKVEE